MFAIMPLNHQPVCFLEPAHTLYWNSLTEALLTRDHLTINQDLVTQYSPDVFILDIKSDVHFCNIFISGIYLYLVYIHFIEDFEEYINMYIHYNIQIIAQFVL